MCENLDSEALHDNGDGNFSTDVELAPPSQSKRIRQRKTTAGTRKIQHAWQEEDIIRLIATVEQHRRLWDVGSVEYKLSKLDAWRSVVDDLCIDGVDANEAKVKWLALRTTFMTNLALLRKKKSGQGANDSYTVNWKFFGNMMFLEANSVQQSTLSTSTLQLQSSVSDNAIVEQFLDSSQPSTAQVAVGSRRKRQCLETLNLTQTPPSSPSPSSSSCGVQAMEILNTAVAALHSADSNSTFCDHLLAELRTLPKQNAGYLRSKLGRVMFDYMDARQAEPPRLSSVQIVGKHGHEDNLDNFAIVQQNNGQNSSAFIGPTPQSQSPSEESTANTQSIVEC